VDNVYNCRQIEHKQDEKVPNLGQSDIQIQNEAQARALSKVPEERQAEVWQQVLETAPDGRVTASHIKKTVRDLEVAAVEKTTRKAASRDTYKGERISDDMMDAFKALADQINFERKYDFRFTSKKTLEMRLESLLGMVRAPLKVEE